MNYIVIILAFLSSALSLCAEAANPATVTVGPSIVGKGPRYIGYNYAHYLPGSNTTAWIARSGVNCIRVWANPRYYEPVDDLPPYGDGVSDQASFIARRAALRADPENNAFINWPLFNDLFENFVQNGVNSCTLNYMLGELRSIGVAVVVEIDGRGYDLPGTFADRWEWWQKHYAMAYHMAKNYDVSMFETVNEPDQIATVTQAEYIEWTKFADDAIRSAVWDVNTSFGKTLQPLIIGPTLKIFNNIDTYGQDKLGRMRLDCLDMPTTYDTLNVYCTHQYNSTGATFASQINTLKTKIPAYNPTGQMLPVMYTEFNRYNTSAWEIKPPEVSLDSPKEFTEVAGILTASMVAGVWGMTSFKLSETFTSTFGKYRTGYNYVEDTGFKNILGAKKGVDVLKLFTRAFAGERNRLSTAVGGSVPNFTAHASQDTSAGVYQIFCVNPSSTTDASITFSVSSLMVTPGTTVTVEEVSAAHQNEVVQLVSLPASGSFTITQPRYSVWLVTVPQGPALTSTSLTAVADVMARGGAFASTTFGTDAAMQVGTSTITPDDNRISYIKFDLSALPPDLDVQRAILHVTGRNPVDSAIINVDVYGSKNSSWTESTLNWNNAPDHASASSTVTNQGTNTFPLGNLSFDAMDQPQRVDVTDFVAEQRAAGNLAAFMLSRPLRFLEDAGDTGRFADMGTIDSSSPSRKPQLLILSTPATAGIQNWQNWDPLD